MNNDKLTTQQVADMVRTSGNTIRRHLCTNGSFYGVKPTKLPSGRLLWDRSDVEHFVNTGSAQEQKKKEPASAEDVCIEKLKSMISELESGELEVLQVSTIPCPPGERGIEFTFFVNEI